MKKIFLYILSLFTLIHGPVSADELVQIWQVDGLSNPESVIYDKANDVLYISNVNGAADEKDGNGFISKVSPDGEVLELKWVTGLNAPKGLAIHNDHLYVADIDSLVEINIPAASIKNSYPDANAKFLNDVTATSDGRIFVSDMVTNKIHLLENQKFSVWLEDAALENPNGLYAENGQLILGAWGVMTDGFATDIPGHLKSINLADKSIQSLGDGKAIGNLDGVEPVGNDFYVTDWMAGKLFRIDRFGNAILLLELVQGMADLEYIEDRSMILLPMMNSNSLLAYQVK